MWACLPHQFYRLILDYDLFQTIKLLFTWAWKNISKRGQIAEPTLAGWRHTELAGGQIPYDISGTQKATAASGQSSSPVHCIKQHESFTEIFYLTFQIDVPKGSENYTTAGCNSRPSLCASVIKHHFFSVWSLECLQAEFMCTQYEWGQNKGTWAFSCPDWAVSLPYKSVLPRGRTGCLLSDPSLTTPTRGGVTCCFKRRHICWWHVGAWPTLSADHSSFSFTSPLISIIILSAPWFSHMSGLPVCSMYISV